MLSGVQTGNGTPHGKYNIRGIAHARTNRKDNIFMQRRLVQNFTYMMERGQGTCRLTNRTRRWTYSALRHFWDIAEYFSMLRCDKSYTRNFCFLHWIVLIDIAIILYIYQFTYSME